MYYINFAILSVCYTTYTISYSMLNLSVSPVMKAADIKYMSDVKWYTGQFECTQYLILASHLIMTK